MSPACQRRLAGYIAWFGRSTRSRRESNRDLSVHALELPLAATPGEVDVSLGGAPHEAGFVERGVDVGKRRRGEVVDVVGEVALAELVAGHRAGAGGCEDRCGVP